MFRNNKGILHNRASLKTGPLFVRPIQGRNNKQNKVIKCKTKKLNKICYKSYLVKSWFSFCSQ